jgi:hypothetical protein
MRQSQSRDLSDKWAGFVRPLKTKIAIIRLEEIPVDLPIACTLTEEQLRERRREVLEPFRADTYQRIELANGYAYELPPEKFLDIARLLDLERQCCQFLTFKIIVEPRQDVRLEITGPPDAKNTIAEFFGS